MNSKLFYSFIALTLTLNLFGKEFPGVLKRTSSIDANKLSYECEIHTRLKDVKLSVAIDTATQFMEAELDNGIRVKGFASDTLDNKTGITVYFLQGGSAPYGQQLTLSIKDGGEWAQFKKSYGGEAFLCQ